MITPEFGLDQLGSIAADVHDRLATADLTALVPSCPGWVVADLIGHLGEAHRWAAHSVRAGNPNAPDVNPPLTDAAELRAWYADSADQIVTALREVRPDHPCWTFGPPRTAAFWCRRQAHEVAVHRWDLATASGKDVGYPEPLAVDAVDEVVNMFFPRQVRLGRVPPLTASLAITVGGQRWVLAGDGTAPTTAEPDATMTGPADALALLLWGRVRVADPRLVLTGDRDAAEAVLAAGIVP